MSATIRRRTFLTGCASGAAGVALLGGQPAQGQPAAPATDRSPAAAGAEAKGFTVYSFGHNVWVRLNDRPFTCYRANPDQKLPYFFPVAGPATGLPMTEESGDPARYPHHRSVWLGCDMMNGQNFWQDTAARGQIVSRGPKAVLVHPPAGQGPSAQRVLITDACDWQAPGKPPVLADRREFVMAAPDKDTRILDASIRLEALADVRVNKTNHSLFSVRAALELAPLGGGRLVNSDGRQGQEATLGRPARWCGFQGTRLGATESIVLMDHPRNPWAPDCPWMTRDYGFISPTPFNWLGQEGWRLPKGDAVQLRYRVAVLAGAIDKDRVDGLWAAFAGA
ncbi:MAG: PmoA family protein [Phycisphaerae bacterium]